MTKLRINDRPAREIEAIYRYIARDSVLGAENVMHAIHSTIEFLRLHPKAGHPTARGTTRMFAVTKYPYLIYYQYLPRFDELRIRSVRHSARRRTVELRESAVEFRV
jgi:plasmid stabilization system protein ParE